MSLFWNIFSNAGKTNKPKVQGFSVSALDQNNEASLKVFYEFFERNPYIAAAVGRIQADVGAHWYEIRKGEKLNKAAQKEFKNMLKASIWYTPRQFVKRLMRDYEVTGNAYVYTAKNWNKITGLQILDPRYVKPVMNAQWVILWYVQNLWGIRAFTRDEVFHLRWDTDLKYEALWRSKMESLFIDLETDKEARDSNLAFFRNNQTPASVIILDPDFDLWDEEQSAKTKKELKQVLESGKYTGWKNRHRASVWQGVKEVLKLQDKISDMEFIETRKFTLDMVCAVYEVPKDMLWMTENSNRSVWDVQSETYYFRIEEKEDLIDEFLSQIIVELFWEEFAYVTLKDNIRTLTVRSKIATELFQKWLLRLNEAREIIQYEKETQPVWEEYFKGKNDTTQPQDTQTQNTWKNQ